MKTFRKLSACALSLAISFSGSVSLVHGEGEVPQATDTTTTTTPTVPTTTDASQTTQTTTPSTQTQENQNTETTTQNTNQETKTDQKDTKDQEEPEIVRLAKVKKVKLTRFSTTAVKVSWSKQTQAKYYHVYKGSTKNGKYTLATTTKKTHALVKGLKNKKTYYFYATASKTKKVAKTDSLPSTKLKMTMKTYTRLITFAGDSIATGITIYKKTTPEMKSSAKKSVVAVVGINTRTFLTKRAFNGKTPLQKLTSQKPYRVYFMLGINEIAWTKTKDVLTNYEVLLKRFKKSSPKSDIVLLSVSPASQAQSQKEPMLKQIPALNAGLKKLAKKYGYHYFDYTSFLKTKDGYLNPKYATPDGYHWQIPAYKKFGEVIGKYDRSLDQ